MLARLRREFIAITMLLVGLVLVGVLGMSFVSNALTLRSITSRILDRALEGDITSAQIGDTTGEQSAAVMLAVVIELRDDGQLIEVSSSPVQLPLDTLDDITAEILSSASDEGECEGYPISWKRTQARWGWRIALVDTYSRDAALRTQALNGLVILATSMVVLFVIAYLLSGWVLRPVAHAWDSSAASSQTRPMSSRPRSPSSSPTRRYSSARSWARTPLAGCTAPARRRRT